MNIQNHRHRTLPPDAAIIPPSEQPQQYSPGQQYSALPKNATSFRPAQRGSMVGSVTRELLQTIIPALLIAILIHLFLAQATRVEGQSMEPTLFGRQRLIIEQLSYRMHPPQRDDIVVIRVPGFDELLIKRVIGLPGDTLAIKQGVVFINGKPLDEPFVNGQPRGSYPTMKIPDGYIFVMGDNRNNSNDSRSFGPVAIENIVGHAWMRYWPLHDFDFMP